MSNSENENVGFHKRCWKCHWLFSDNQFQELLQQHTCFKDFDESQHGIVISNEGIVSMTRLTASKKRFLQEIELIEEVRKRPCLFQRNFHVTADYKANMWEEVKKNVTTDFTITEMKQMWRNLRDQFKKAKTASNTDIKKFRHYERMTFMENNRNKVQNLSALSDVSNRLSHTSNSSVRRILEPSLEENQSLMQHSFQVNESEQLPGLSQNSTIHFDENDQDIQLVEHHLPNLEIQKENDTRPLQNQPDTSSKQKLTVENKGRKEKCTSNKKKTEELQKLVLDKIRSFKNEQPDPIAVFLSSLRDSVGKLNHLGQLRVRRRFMEVLEEEHINQLTE